METIVFLGSNKSGSGRDAIMAAKELGFFTILLTDRKKWIKQRTEFPDVHQMILVHDLQNKEMIYKQISLIKNQGKLIKAFISFIDPYVSLAAQIAMELNLSELSVDALYKMEDKTRFREVLKDNSVNPFYQICSYENDCHKMLEKESVKFPFVLKTPVSKGSKDVFLIHSIKEFKKTINNLKASFPNTPILIEEYMDGPQYLIELVVASSNITIVAIIEQEISNISNRFIITGYKLPALLTDKVNEKLHIAIDNIIKEMGLINGTCHLEMRYVNHEWKLIEINPRISGGAINQLIYEATGINLVKETLKLSLGWDLHLKPTKNENAFVQFLTITSPGKLIRVTGKNKAQSIEGVKCVYVKPRKGSILTPPLSMGDRYAYVLATSEDPLKAREIAKSAAKEIKFFLEPL